MPFPKVNILGVHFDNVTMDQMINQLKRHIEQEEKVFLVTGNPEIIMYAQNHPAYKDIIVQADYNIPDGIGIVKASRILGHPVKERVTGFDTMMNLLKEADKHQYKVYFLGAKDEVLDLAKKNIKKKFPNLDLVGAHHGYFSWTESTVVTDIQRLKPDLVFVGMGFPLQENWIFQHLPDFQKGIFIGVGGSLDVLAGLTKRAPEPWQKYSAEWLYRLIQRPSRGKRMIVLPLFALRVFAQKIQRKP